MFQFTLMYFVLLIVHHQVFVFALVNFKYMNFRHAYFVISFIIACIYLAVFALVVVLGVQYILRPVLLPINVPSDHEFIDFGYKR